MTTPPSPETVDRIRGVIATSVLDCPVDQVDDSTLTSLDSIGRITLLVELENTFEVELTNEEYDVAIFSSLASLGAFVDGRVSLKN